MPTSVFDAERLTELAELFRPEELSELITTLGEEVLSALHQARVAQAAGDLRGVAEAAHTLCNSGRMVGAVRLADQAAALELRARTEPADGDLAPLIDELDRSWRDAGPIIAATVAELGATNG